MFFAVLIVFQAVFKEAKKKKKNPLALGNHVTLSWICSFGRKSVGVLSCVVLLYFLFLANYTFQASTNNYRRLFGQQSSTPPPKFLTILSPFPWYKGPKVCQLSTQRKVPCPFPPVYLINGWVEGLILNNFLTLQEESHGKDVYQWLLALMTYVCIHLTHKVSLFSVGPTSASSWWVCSTPFKCLKPSLPCSFGRQSWSQHT